MGLESFGKKAKNTIRAVVLGGSIVASGSAEAGPRNMPSIPPSLDQLKQMQAADLASIERSKNALNEKVAADLKMIDEKTKAHVDSPEGRAEMEQLKKQFGVTE